MEETIKQLISILANSNNTTLMVIVAILILGLGIYKVLKLDIVQEIIKTYLNRNNVKKVELSKHILFTTRSKLLIRVNTFVNHSDINSELFKKFMFYKINIVCDNSLKLIGTIDKSRSIYDVLIEATNDMINTYENRYKEYCVKLAVDNKQPSTNGEDVFNYINEGFKSIHKSTVDMIIISLELVRNSALVNKEEDVMDYYFTLINFALERGILDAEKLFGEMNGQLKKKLEGKEIE